MLPGNPSDVVIEIRELYKYYGDTRAVGPLSAEIEQGEIVGLLGLNGTGKTTTLRVLACDLLPTSGTVKVDGIDVVERPDAVRSLIGYLPDTPPLYGEMKVSEYLRFAAKLRGVSGSKVDERVGAVAEQTGITGKLDHVIATLSHGFKQRVGIAQAVVHDPKFVVLDEPISGLDPEQIVKMRALVRSLKPRHTVLISSHILREISETCDHILVIRDGEIVARGTEDDLTETLIQGTSVDITVRPGEVDVERLLADLADVDEVDELMSSEPDTLAFRVSARSDVREALSAELVKAGAGVLELKPARGDLEKVFLELTGGKEAGS